MRPLHLSILLLLTCFPGCGGDAETPAETPETPETPSYQPGRPGSEVGYPATVMRSSPFGGASRGTEKRIQQMPSNRFFQENYYPGSAVIDVKRIFGSPTVLLVTQDSFEAIDAFYAKSFTLPDGTLEGRPGSYYRMTNGGGMERVQIQKADNGGFKIVLQL